MKKILFIFPLLIAGLLFNGCDKDEDAVSGCMDSTACNFSANATEDDGSCTFADAGYDCDDNCLSTYMAGDTEYDLDGMAFFLDYGDLEYDYYGYGEGGNTNYDLYMMSDGFYWGADYYLAGSGNYFYFELFFENGIEGTYSFNEDWGYSETFSGNSWYASDIDADEEVDNPYFTGGSLTITSLGGDNYEVSFNGENADGEVAGCFTGEIEYLEYQYARNLKTDNQRSVNEKKDRNR